MIRTLFRGWSGRLMELNAFEGYMIKIGAGLVNGEGDLSEGRESRDYALWQYGIGVEFRRSNDAVTVSAEGTEEDISKFEKKLADDAASFGLKPG